MIHTFKFGLWSANKKRGEEETQHAVLALMASNCCTWVELRSKAQNDKHDTDQCGFFHSQISFHLGRCVSWIIKPSIFSYYSLAFLTLRCAQTTGYQLLISQRCKFILYLIGVGHKKQIIIGCWCDMKRIHSMHSYLLICLISYVR